MALPAKQQAQQISTLTDRITRLTEALRPASDDMVAARILAMHNAGMAFPQSVKADVAVKAYVFALRNSSMQALKAVSVKLLQGEVPGLTRFLPTPAELAALVKAEQARIAGEVHDAKMTLEALQFRPVHRSEEERERIRARVAAFRESVRLEKQKVDTIAIADDEEKREYWRRIMAIGDAKNITPEQRAFRDQVHAAIVSDDEDGFDDAKA